MTKKTVDRINEIRTDVMSRKGSFAPGTNPFLRDTALWRAWSKERSVTQIMAGMLYELVKISDANIYSHWKLAGEHLLPRYDQPFFGFFMGEYEEIKERIFELGLSKDEVEEVKKCTDWWADLWRREPHSDTGEIRYENELREVHNSLFWARGWMVNHSIRDYEKLLLIGFNGIKAEIEELLSNADISDPGFPEKENFWLAGIQVCRAGVLLGEKYADAAAELYQKADKGDKPRLKRIEELCNRVPAEGANTLEEAVQSLWLGHVLTCGEDGINANSIGRLDKILYPYYKKDIADGTITRDMAVELMEELACKLYLDYDVQAITLGGMDKYGNNSVSEMSHIILEATENLNFIRDISVRLNEKTPSDFVDRCSRLLVKGGGIPFFFNDAPFIQALTERGIKLEDARDYAPIGCIELTIPGKANPHAVSGWFNVLKCLELALYGGYDPVSNTQTGPGGPALNNMDSYGDLFGAYMKQVEYFSRLMIYHCNRGELQQREEWPLPLWSVLTDDCIIRGRDITNGGPLYNYQSICLMGVPDTADSLIAIKKLVFEDKRIDPKILLKALKENFNGHEPLRKLLLNNAPKYGNDIPEVDETAAEVTKHFIQLMDKAKSPLGGRYFTHLFTFKCNIDFGNLTGATPDGRLAGEPLAYSLSAHQGRDINGISALLNSISRMPHHMAAGASASIIEIDPQLVEGEAGQKRLSQIIQAAIKMGVGQMQFNIVTAEKLKQAQKYPEKHGNIPVRVAGYSQMFKLLNRPLQDHIIARTKHKE